MAWDRGEPLKPKIGPSPLSNSAYVPSRAMPFKTMPEFSSWRTNVGNGLAHSVMVEVLEIVVVVVGALTVVVV